jgi:hypothetical protein
MNSIWRWAWSLVKMTGCTDPHIGGYRNEADHQKLGPALLVASASFSRSGLLDGVQLTEMVCRMGQRG